MSDLISRQETHPEKHTEEHTETHACDCISREAVLDLKIIAPIAPVMNGEAVHYEQVVLVRDLEKLPSVEPERKPGKWIWNKRTGEYECSECGCNPTYEGITPDDSEIDKYRYCRWCGAKMEVDG